MGDRGIVPVADGERIVGGPSLPVGVELVVERDVRDLDGAGGGRRSLGAGPRPEGRARDDRQDHRGDEGGEREVLEFFRRLRFADHAIPLLSPIKNYWSSRPS